MADVKYFFDLHVHPSLKPFRYNPNRSIWINIPDENDPDHCENIPSIAKGIVKDVKSDGQSNLLKCQRSRTRVICVALYPIERGMFDLRDFLAGIFNDDKEVNLGACMTSIEKATIQGYYDGIQNDDPVDYYRELFEEYQYLVAQSNDTQPGQKMVIAENYNQLKQALDADDNSIVSVITIEGMHSLLKYNSFSELGTFDNFVNTPGHPAFDNYAEMITNNIQIIKEWGGGKHSPFFITFAHHFWNLLCGHARSFGGLTRTFALNQDCGINLEITELGLIALKQLLTRENGRRILIDTKHMSVKARKQFYKLRKEEYSANNDAFPIICSHAAVNGIKTLDEILNKEDKDRHNNNKYFNAWTINLTNEDIIEIINSDGLMGIILHEDRMPGKIVKKRIKKFKDQLDLKRDEYVKLIMGNIFHMVRVKNEVSAWDHICLGSDFDGIINFIDIYENVEKYDTLADHMFQFLNRPLAIPEISLTVEDFEKLKFNLSPQEILEKVMYKNMDNFLKKYFNEQYLTKRDMA